MTNAMEVFNISCSIEKIIELDFHVAAAMSGLSADARILFEHARVESQGHRFTYDEPMKVLFRYVPRRPRL